MAHTISRTVPPRPDDLLVYDPQRFSREAEALQRAETAVATVEIVIPVYNEEVELERSVRTLQSYLAAHFPLSWMITIADNASTDRTWTIACRLALQFDGVRAVHLDQKGRGRALRAVWSRSSSPVVAYMDVDLSTDLAALLPLVAPLVSGHSDVAIGTRLAPTARVARGPRREAISRSYNLLLRAALHAGFSDAQCGFKAVRGDAVHQLLPLIADQGWFFDTEMLVLAEHSGLRIHEVPVDWVDDSDSRVNVVATARGDLAGVWRMVRRFARNDAALPVGVLADPEPAEHEPVRRPLSEQLVRFGSIGVVSTALFAVGFVLLAPTLGPFAAAAMTLLICSVANNAANRRLTFALSGHTRRFRHFARGLVVALLPLAAIIAVLGVLSLMGWTATLPAVVALTVVSCAVGLVRFVLLQRWVFRSAGSIARHVDAAPTTEHTPAEPDGAPTAGELVDTGDTDRSWWRRVVRGPEDDPEWVRPALLALLVTTGVLYIWGLGASGWANSFYSAAVQAGTKSWKAFFFGSSDASNFITVDKPPASLWAMELSARMFGVNSWSILVPQALEGVAAVGVLYASVRRWFSPAAGLIAGAVMALTPVAVLMFRFNNPDSLLVLLMVCAAYALTRALENGSSKWLVLVGVLVGFGFLAKMLQAFVVVPGFALTYLVAGPPKFGRRLVQLLAAGVAMFAAAAWWVAIVEMWPKSSRPYIGGSQDNSLLNLVFGYNGLGRVTGNETGSVVGGGRQGAAGMWGPTGWLRMFNGDFGGQASWLIPAALILGGAGLVFTIRKPRVDRSRAAIMLWGSWLAVTAVVFSLSKGIIHPYYTVALAPAIGALIGAGGHIMWAHRREPGGRGWAARGVLAGSIVVSAWWAYELLRRTPGWNAWLRTLVVVAGAVSAAALLFGPLVERRIDRAVAVVAVAASVVAGLAGPAAYAINTAKAAHEGALVSAGPSVRGRRGGSPGRLRRNSFPTFPSAGNGPFPNVRAGRGNTTLAPNAGGTGPFGGGGFGAPRVIVGPRSIGGLLVASKPSAELVALLEEHADDYKWVLATVGSEQASGYQLATGEPVMSIGGFNGTDPTPTLGAFQKYVADRQIHYFVTGGTGGRSDDANGITNWVESNFSAVSVGGQTLYDLTKPL